MNLQFEQTMTEETMLFALLDNKKRGVWTNYDREKTMLFLKTKKKRGGPWTNDDREEAMLFLMIKKKMYLEAF